MAIQHFKDISIVDGDIKINIDLSRYDERFADAQYLLDGMVMNSMVPYMPKITGSFINLTRAQSAAIQGTGKVVAGAPPMGRFLYMGKVMVDPVTGSAWARYGAKKIVTEKDLNLRHGNPKATPQWFETAKRVDKDKWIKAVEKQVKHGR